MLLVLLKEQNLAVEETSSAIYRLNVDCFEKVFDYLSKEDLHTFGLTCKRMSRMVGHYFRQEMPGHELRWTDECFAGFRKYAKSVIVDYDSEMTNADWNVLQSVEKIELCHMDLERIKVIPKGILNQLQDVSLFDCRIDEPLFESLVELCKNLKSLIITEIDVDDEWFTRKYPKLENFELFPKTSTKIDNLEMFFRQNPAVRSFTTNSEFLLMNEATLMAVKLDALCIDFIDDDIDESACAILNTLHAKGGFKRLHIGTQADQTIIELLSSLPFVTGLWFPGITEEIDLSSLENLKFLWIFSDLEKITNKAALAQSLKGLELLLFHEARVDDILPFIRLSAKLKKIIVKNELIDEADKAIDPVAMNRDREKLLIEMLDVEKVTIYIPERSYLATKWKTTQMDLKLIKVRHCDLWEYDYQKC